MTTSAVLAEREPIVAAADEQQLVDRLHAALEVAGAPTGAARLIAADGQAFELPDSVLRVLVRIVHEMASGNAVVVLPVHARLTTQQAADLLGMSRPHLIKLLDAGAIAYSRPGERKHRRILLSDLMAYKTRQQIERRAALDEVAAEAERLGLRY